MEEIKRKIQTIAHFPKEGIMFRDITSLLKDPVGLGLCIDDLKTRYENQDIDLIVGIDSRGFILGGALAYLLGKGFVPVRKKGKLPGKVASQDYALEYGTDTLEIHEDAIPAGKNVVIVDDLIATGGTALAACNLVTQLGGNVIECAFIIDLPDIGGRKKLETAGYKTYAQTQFEGH